MTDEMTTETEPNVAELFESMKAERDALLARESQLKEQLKGIVTKAPESLVEDDIVNESKGYDVINIIKEIYGVE